jgi:hypothetical protein
VLVVKNAAGQELGAAELLHMDGIRQVALRLIAEHKAQAAKGGVQ